MPGFDKGPAFLQWNLGEHSRFACLLNIVIHTPIPCWKPHKLSCCFYNKTRGNSVERQILSVHVLLIVWNECSAISQRTLLVHTLHYNAPDSFGICSFGLGLTKVYNPGAHCVSMFEPWTVCASTPWRNDTWMPKKTWGEDWGREWVLSWLSATSWCCEQTRRPIKWCILPVYLLSMREKCFAPWDFVFLNSTFTLLLLYNMTHGGYRCWSSQQNPQMDIKPARTVFRTHLYYGFKNIPAVYTNDRGDHCSSVCHVPSLFTNSTLKPHDSCS